MSLYVAELGARKMRLSRLFCSDRASLPQRVGNASKKLRRLLRKVVAKFHCRADGGQHSLVVSVSCRASFAFSTPESKREVSLLFVSVVQLLRADNVLSYKAAPFSKSQSFRLFALTITPQLPRRHCPGAKSSHSSSWRPAFIWASREESESRKAFEAIRAHTHFLVSSGCLLFPVPP